LAAGFELVLDGTALLSVRDQAFFRSQALLPCNAIPDIRFGTLENSDVPVF
jgi:hypothetical protein